MQADLEILYISTKISPGILKSLSCMQAAPLLVGIRERSPFAFGHESGTFSPINAVNSQLIYQNDIPKSLLCIQLVHLGQSRGYSQNETVTCFILLSRIGIGSSSMKINLMEL